MLGANEEVEFSKEDVELVEAFAKLLSKNGETVSIKRVGTDKMVVGTTNGEFSLEIASSVTGKAAYCAVWSFEAYSWEHGPEQVEIEIGTGEGRWSFDCLTQVLWLVYAFLAKQEFDGWLLSSVRRSE